MNMVPMRSSDMTAIYYSPSDVKKGLYGLWAFTSNGATNTKSRVQ